MSSEEQKGGSPSGPGKSLALMQQRLLNKSQNQGASESTDAAGTASSAQSAPTQQPTTSESATSNPAPSVVQNRPKGKDFAAMAMNAKTAPAPAPVAATPAAPQPQPPGRPKGKDFAAMANRMPASQSVKTDAAVRPVSLPPMDPARAAKMQAAARAAAGYNPDVASGLTAPTPPSGSPSGAMQRSSQPGRAAAVAQSQYTHPNQAAVPPTGPSPMVVDAQRQQQSQIPRPKPATKRSTSRSSGGQQGGRRTSGTAKAPGAAASAPTPAPAPKPTPQPTKADARLSLSATTAGATTSAGAPHMAPLIGQRLRDLVTSIDPHYALDTDAEEQVLQLADDFLDKVTRQSIRLAQHRGSKTMDVQDVQLALSKQWGIVVPGLGAPTLIPTKPANRASASTSSGAKRRASEGGSGASRAGGSKKAKTASSSTATKTT